MIYKELKIADLFLFSKDNELKEIKNCLFKNNDYLGISGGLVIKLVPSQNNYIK